MTESNTIKCPYCKKPARLVLGRDIYPHRHDLSLKPFWSCAPCGAWVGCHQGTKKPLGRLADADLRKAKMAAHAAFDPIWKSGGMKRNEAYYWLAYRMSIPLEKCHIGMFDVENCRKVINICELFYEDKGK